MKKLSAHQRKARDFLQRENWDQALAELQHVLASDASNPALHNQIGDVHLRKNDVDQACRHFEQSIELYAELSLHNNAVALCRKVIRLCPERLEMRYRLALLRLDQGLRADAVASLEDYFEQLNPEGEQAVAALETRSREILEKFPDVAPVGKILEKLESVRSFQVAFEIVQRLAQRATDSGDDAAARRYTEKMRSLRVLVQGEGGGDLLKPEHMTLPEPVASEPPAAQAALQPPERLPGDEQSSDAVIDPPPVAIPTPLTAPTLPAPPAAPTASTPLTAAIPTATPAPAAADVPTTPNLDLDLDLSVETSTPGSDATLSLPPVDLAPAAPQTAQPAPEGAPELQMPDVATSDPAPAHALDDAARTVASEERVSEYEIPETSLEEIAGLLQDEEVQPPATTSPVDDATTVGANATHGDSAAATGRTWQAHVDLDAEDAVPPQHDGPRTTSAGSPEPVAEPSRVSAATDPAVASTAADAAASAAERTPAAPASVISVTVPPFPPRPRGEVAGHTNGSTARPNAEHTAPATEPVWIPDPWVDEQDPNPGAHGEVRELNEVIDTFREQMASALGDDGGARYDLGVAYFEMGLYNEALAEFEVAARCEGFQDRSLEMIAACLMSEGRHAEMVDRLVPVLQTEGPTSHDRLALRYSLALGLEALGRGDEARQHFEKVALVDSGFKDVKVRLQRF